MQNCSSDKGKIIFDQTLNTEKVDLLKNMNMLPMDY